MQTSNTARALQSEREWSRLQEAIFSFPRRKNLTVESRAGVGKTTSIAELVRRMPETERVGCFTFGVEAAKQLTEKLPEGRKGSTLHSRGAFLVFRRYPGAIVDNEKGWHIAKQAEIWLRERHPEQVCDLVGAGAILKLARWGKLTMIAGPRSLANIAREQDLVDWHRDDRVYEQALRAAGEGASKAMALSAARPDVMDYDDMVFLPWRLDLRSPYYTQVIVDEAQDMSAAQMWIARTSVVRNGRIVLVGDSYQAIYTWRGAEANGMARMTAELGATVLPLTWSYRCPASVARLAQLVVPDFVSAPGAPEGAVLKGSAIDARPGDFVISRTKAPLFRACLKLLARGIPAILAKMDIRELLEGLIRQSKAHSVEALLAWLDVYQQTELQRAERIENPEKHEEKCEEIRDRVECMRALCEGLDTISEVEARIRDLCADDRPEGKVVCTTTHRAKGLERRKVFVLCETYKPARGGEEARLWYVAITRAQETLVLVDPHKLEGAGTYLKGYFGN